METIAEHVNNGLLNAEIIYAESEHSALSSLIGASLAGARTFTATASQGLEYMHEVLHLVSGTRLPIVMVIANRALSAPINIWCFSKEANVLMANLSYKPISQIKEGEMVIGKDKKGNLVFTKVKKTFKRKTEKLIKLKTEKFDLICTPEHKFYYHPSHSHWTKAKNLKNKKLPWFGYGFEKNNEFKKGWLAGIADGDGCFYKQKNTYYFRLKVKDKEIITNFVKFSNELGFNIREVDYDRKRGYFTSILTNTRETIRFKKFLIKSKNSDFYRGYLSGIYDAEGSGPFKVKQAVIYNSNKKIINFIAKIMKKLDINFKIYSDKRRDKLHLQDNYHIKINNVPEFFIKCPPILERKRKNLLKMTIKSVKSRLEISEIKPINKLTEVYNLETEVNNYIVNGLLAHNCDQSDAFNCRDTSWIQLFCKNTQESFDTVIQAYKLAESMKLPVMINIDGFTLSHLIEPVELLNQKQVNSFLPKKVQNLLDTNKPNTIGPVAFPNSYQEFKHQQKDAMLNSIKKIKIINSQFNKNFKRSYGDGLIEIYGKNKNKMIIALGSVCNTIEDMIDNGEKISLLRIKTYRPFPIQEIIKATKNIKEIIVLDRSYSYGLAGPLFSEISSILKNKKIKSGIVGLGGRDITPETIKKIINSKKQEKWDDAYDT